MDPVRNGLDQGHEEGRCRDARGFLDQLHEGKLAGPVDGHEEMELSLGRPDLGDVDVEEADRAGLERPLRRFVALHVRETG